MEGWSVLGGDGEMYALPIETEIESKNTFICHPELD
jgi:hypothetical protein